MTTFEKSVAIVTGASRGIGLAVAQRLARDGVAVALVYRADAERAGRAVRQILEQGDRAMAIQADVSREKDVRRMFDDADRQLGTRRSW